MNNVENLQTAFSLGGREIVTFIQYGFSLEVDIEIQGLLLLGDTLTI